MLKRLHHLVLFYTDTARAKSWFEAVGFVYLRGHEGMHWFQLGSSEVMLHPAESVTVAETTVHVGVDDVNALFVKCRVSGLEPFDHQAPGAMLSTPVTRPWGDREFELTDPEGHRWGFTEAAS